MAGNRLARSPCRIRYSGMKTVTIRLTRMNPAISSAMLTMEAVGSGIVMPNATKNSVMKKSRSVVTLAVTSSA